MKEPLMLCLSLHCSTPEELMKQDLGTLRVLPCHSSGQDSQVPEDKPALVFPWGLQGHSSHMLTLLLLLCSVAVSIPIITCSEGLMYLQL